MLEFAKSEFDLAEPKKDGGTLRDHLMQAWTSSNRMPQELIDAPPLPDSVKHIWQYYLEIDDDRGSNGFSLNPISYSSIASWCKLTRINLEWWEIQAIKAIDKLFRQKQAEITEKREAKK